MAIGTWYQGEAPPESTRTEKAKQSGVSMLSSSKTTVGDKRSRADQRGSDTSESEADSPLPPKKKSRAAEKSKKRRRGKTVVEVIDVDDVEDIASGEGKVIELSDSEEVAVSAKRDKGKQRATSDGEKGSDAEEDSSDSELDAPDETLIKIESTVDAYHRARPSRAINEELKKKKKIESTADLLTIFSLPFLVEFKSKKKGTVSIERGRWCSICKENPTKKAIAGRRAGWYVGGNSSCRRHITSIYYPMYVAWCKEAGIKETEQATPKKVWAAKLAKLAKETKEKEQKKVAGAQLQLTLDGVVQKVETPTASSQTAILDAVMQHVVCGDQALLVANNPTFTNRLVVMRPKTTKEELPSRAVVQTNVKNKFVQFIKGVRSDIGAAPSKASINHDLWTEHHSSTAFFGITAQWIDVKDLRPWTVHAEVIGFHKVLGDHGGRNLGRQLLKVTDRAGITSKKEGNPNKLGHVTADNASNNGTTAKEVAYVLEAQEIED